MIDAEAGTDHSLSVEGLRRPGEGKSRVEISVVWVVEVWISRTGRSIDWSGTGCDIEGAGTEAHAVELIQVKHRGPVGGLICNAVVVPANPRGERERRRDLKFILKIRHVERTAQPMTAPWGVVADGGAAVQVTLRDGVVVAEAEDIVGGLPLI